MAQADGEVLLERRGGVALVTLNRPKALNALTLSMYRRLDPDLLAWARDPAVKAVVIRGAGGRAFCAGGDVRAMWAEGQGLRGPDDPKRVFFREEYRLIQRVHRFPKPYVALMDGITMGGGCGMSINGTYRVATEKTMIAMPEVAIGLFPDVGATRFLAGCPGRLGLYLGLTGARLGAADARHAGLATHFVPSARLEELIEALAGAEPRADAEAVAAILARFDEDPGPSPLAAHQAGIDRAFAAGTVEAILAALANEPGAWARDAAQAIEKGSPTSAKITHRQIAGGRGDMPIEEALALEYRMTQHCMDRPDFFEGVRAALVDKDQAPAWRPDRLEAVDEATVAAHFVSLGDNEITFLDA